MAMMSNQPLVSSIIIFFNGEKFLAEAIESALAQTYDNWELLLVDDGSTDNSTTIALDYAQKYSQTVRYVNHKNHQNLGTSASRNLGIECACGDYIAFLDADDVWLPLKLAQQVAILETYPEVAMVYGTSQYWYSWTGKAEDEHRDYFIGLGVPPNTVVMPPNLLPQLWQGDEFQYPLPSNAMIRATIYNVIGGFDENFRVLAEDLAFYTKLELKYPVFVASEYWIKYRQHQDSVTANSKTGSGWYEAVGTIFFEWADNYLIEQDLKDTEGWKILQRVKSHHNPPFPYGCWHRCLEVTMSICRILLPKSLRHLLWLKIGSKLYENT
jgi:glycosyltransferase involved in cell wall biosynthesis